MRLRPVWAARLLLALLLLALAAAPAWALTVQGKVVGPTGKPVAGAYVSDGERIVATGKDGAFRLGTRPELVVALTAPPGLVPAKRWWWPAPQAADLDVLHLKSAPYLSSHHMRLAVVSDPHLYTADTQPPWAKGQVDPRLPMRMWKRTLVLLRQIGPDLILLPGDLCMAGEKGDEVRGRAAMELAATATDMVPGQWRATPGNHDVRYNEGKVHLDIWREFMGPARSVYMLGPVAVIMLDNVGLSRRRDGKPRNCGLTSPRALAWLKALLDLLPQDTPLLLVSHFPLISPLAGGNPLYPRSVVSAPGPEGLALRDVDQSTVAVLKLLAGRPVVGLISGHQHAMFDVRLMTTHHLLHLVGAPALCGRWWQGDMNYGPVSFPPAYLQGFLVRDKDRWRLYLHQEAIKFLAPYRP